MKIKHWQGYGSVSATKVPDKNCTLHIRVVGNHEWGLERNDVYDLFNWLVKRFDRTQTSFTEWNNKLIDARYQSGSVVINGLDTDTCDYYFMY